MGNYKMKTCDDWIDDFKFYADDFPVCIVISDVSLNDYQMIYVNKEFCRTTGYSKEESIGRNCRFLQGPRTELESIDTIRDTLSKGGKCHVKITNYRKNGKTFENFLTL